VVLGDNAELFKTEVISSDNIFFGGCGVEKNYLETLDITAKIRYAAKPAQAKICFLEDGRVKTIFKDAQRAPTPGQSIVFYDGDLVIGGGFID
ncbi:MAG: tRNA 2-thiouridine(34) synthase MnmA, partial [Firmicutes bacterium]|nr:tRNA 2-thiouridine(34) synthase MnmA [Bacillota bacterium]